MTRCFFLSSFFVLSSSPLLLPFLSFTLCDTSFRFIAYALSCVCWCCCCCWARCFCFIFPIWYMLLLWLGICYCVLCLVLFFAFIASQIYQVNLQWTAHEHCISLPRFHIAQSNTCTWFRRRREAQPNLSGTKAFVDEILLLSARSGTIHRPKTKKTNEKASAFTWCFW